MFVSPTANSSSQSIEGLTDFTAANPLPRAPSAAPKDDNHSTQLPSFPLFNLAPTTSVTTQNLQAMLQLMPSTVPSTDRPSFQPSAIYPSYVNWPTATAATSNLGMLPTLPSASPTLLQNLLQMRPAAQTAASNDLSMAPAPQVVPQTLFNNPFALSRPLDLETALLLANSTNAMSWSAAAAASSLHPFMMAGAFPGPASASLLGSKPAPSTPSAVSLTGSTSSGYTLHSANLPAVPTPVTATSPSSKVSLGPKQDSASSSSSPIQRSSASAFSAAPRHKLPPQASGATSLTKGAAVSITGNKRSSTAAFEAASENGSDTLSECSSSHAEPSSPRESDGEGAAGSKMHTCPKCLRVFRRSDHLHAHIRTHTDERPFACPHCPRSFKRKDHLTNHLGCHTGHKPFSCDFCNKKFKRGDHVLIHRRVHTGERPFNCNQCDKSYSSKSSLARHVRGHDA